jgi:hypothetical protein
MNWLPIVNRELRVAARKRSTFWLRVAAALTALVIGGGCMVFGLMPGAGMFRMGSVLFAILTWICLVAGLSAGLFFTSDCLSEEKREGTLGLLFLTDLRGYDVTLGKLLATSLRGFYALLAVLPILAMTLFMGGVAGGHYWKGALALVNALFFSLAIGIAVSSVSRDSQKALMGTLLLLLVLTVGGPVTDGAIAGIKNRSFEPRWSLASPAYVLQAAGAFTSSSYWRALAVTHLLGWAMLGLASALVPHTWQERKKAGAMRTQTWGYAWRYGGARRRLRLRRKLIGLQPVAWLACRERWQSLGLWFVVLLLVGGFVTVLLGALPEEGWIVWSYVGGLFILVLYIWAASQSCRFFVEARRSGLLELVLATPLSEQLVVAGQWQALRRMFGVPVLLLLGVHLLGSTLAQTGVQRATARATAVTSSVTTNQSGTVTSYSTVVIRGPAMVRRSVATNTVAGTNSATVMTTPFFQPLSPGWQKLTAAGTAAASVAGTAADLLALCWFGMWMGLTSKSANLATLKTALFVLVIPWFVMMFGTGMVMAAAMAGLAYRFGGPPSMAWMAWWPFIGAVLSAVVTVAKDIAFIIWSRRKLHSSFRDEAARSLGQPRCVTPQVPPASIPAPPVIAESC